MVCTGCEDHRPPGDLVLRLAVRGFQGSSYMAQIEQEGRPWSVSACLVSVARVCSIKPSSVQISMQV